MIEPDICAGASLPVSTPATVILSVLAKDLGLREGLRFRTSLRFEIPREYTRNDVNWKVGTEPASLNSPRS